MISHYDINVRHNKLLVSRYQVKEKLELLQTQVKECETLLTKINANLELVKELKDWSEDREKDHPEEAPCCENGEASTG